MPSDEVILEVKDLVKYFPIAGHHLQEEDRRRPRSRGVNLQLIGRDPRAGRRVRVRQVDPRQAPHGARASDLGRRRVQGRRHVKLRQEVAGLRRQIQIVLQDPYTSLNPRMSVGDIIGERSRDPRRWLPRVTGRKRVRCCSTSWAQPGEHQRVPAPVLRRSASAHRPRTAPGSASRDHHSATSRCPRSTWSGAPGPGDEPARGPAEGVQPVLSIFIGARPVRRPAHLRRVAVMYLGKVVVFLGPRTNKRMTPKSYTLHGTCSAAVPVPGPYGARAAQPDYPAVGHVPSPAPAPPDHGSCNALLEGRGRRRAGGASARCAWRPQRRPP